MVMRKSMLRTRSSGYTVLSCYRNRGQTRNLCALKRHKRENLPAVCAAPFQTQLAFHVIVSRFNHVQLLFVCPLYLTMGQIIGPLQETSSFSAPYHTKPACLAPSAAVREFSLPEKFSPLSFTLFVPCF